jgi:CBS domain-containing protein
MKFTVRDWMMDVVVFVDPDSTVSEALATMRRRYIHSVIVNKTATNPQYGIVTSTDISDKIIAQEQNPSRLKVREVMTTPLITVSQDMLLKDCARIMREHHIHHIPVVGDAGDVIGMISATDFMVAAEAIGRQPGERII